MSRLIWLLLLLPAHFVLGQERCQVLMQPGQETKAFENWIQQKIAQRQIRTQAQGGTQADEILTIPIVIHVVHNGENLGEGSNISDEQIQSQFQVLNLDFRRLNADTTDTPMEFRQFASDPGIEFVLAKQDPEGLPTTGITRTKGTKSSWRFSDLEELASLSLWPSDVYFNIWVSNLQPPLLGFAQFPISDLEGLEEVANVNPKVDGVAIGHRYFGSIEYGDFPELSSPFDLGRTATHEIGHFLGLRHVWGDVQGQAGCSVDDFVSDTPLSNENYLGCADHPQTSCGSVDMTSNYLNFSNDACMDIFSSGQTERMRAVLDSSPRRASLVNSIGTQDPVIVDNNLGIRQILSPAIGECDQLVLPVVEVRNYGTNETNSFSIRLEIDGQLGQELTLNMTLQPLELVEVEFDAVALPNSGVFDFSFEIFETNGSEDNFPSNNSAQIRVESARDGLLTSVINFDQTPIDWVIRNPDQAITWETKPAPGNGLDNQALALNFYNYDLDRVGAFDYFISPLLDLSGAIAAEVSFKVAYSRSSRDYPEGLMVGISRDCANTVAPEDIPYSKFGGSLATRPPMSNEFVPQSADDWRTEVVDLSEFLGLLDLQLLFIGQNGFGNNLYIDDIVIRIIRQFDVEILFPVPLSCENELTPEVRIVNPRVETIQTTTARVVIPGELDDVYQFDNLNTPPGQSVVLEFPTLLLDEGDYDFIVTILEIDGDTSGIQGRNIDSTQFVIDQTIVEIPVRETFEGSDTDWITLDGAINWEPIRTDSRNNRAVYVANHNNPFPNSTSWLASPVVDMSRTIEASVFFSVSYANNPGISDTLQVLASIDCGNTFTELLYQKAGAELAISESEEAWFPQTELDWRTEFIDISVLSGFPDVRFAFVSTNSGGNNVFVDNIEFFLSTNPDPVQVDLNQYLIYPNPGPKVFQVAFNLAEKQDLTVGIYDSQGRLTLETRLQGVLNQTKTFDLRPYPYGVYFLKIVGESFSKIDQVSLSY